MLSGFEEVTKELTEKKPPKSRAEYQREWKRKHPGKSREYDERYWRKRLGILEPAEEK